ncbi:uncharacterized protein B0I36DRAFT_337072 [Microdochium trichocladiopsis]|uniref:Uncharacterized protein n=1 Tax=Microdochium trichocladiopsis TaxID=1682393 RepID=A0A9P9BMA2_9PEZI|nr:uncharacterized protein B0I36DRAFT_337072 [Microdochium trichocladiopsis]KAH7016225.1 hypothetical protein B0I36DRAFT_337072 [Microdochium trichocladiopsis]
MRGVTGRALRPYLPSLILFCVLFRQGRARAVSDSAAGSEGRSVTSWGPERGQFMETAGATHHKLGDDKSPPPIYLL